MNKVVVSVWRSVDSIIVYVSVVNLLWKRLWKLVGNIFQFMLVAMTILLSILCWQRVSSTAFRKQCTIFCYQHDLWTFHKGLGLWNMFSTCWEQFRGGKNTREMPPLNGVLSVQSDILDHWSHTDWPHDPCWDTGWPLPSILTFYPDGSTSWYVSSCPSSITRCLDLIFVWIDCRMTSLIGYNCMSIL